MATSAHLAIYNFGIHVDEFGSEPVQGFSLREPANFEAAERAPGFIARSGYDGEPGPPSWGPQVFPRFLAERGGGAAVSSLSLWCDIGSLMAFTYTGVHANALKYARRWNVVQDWPPLVMFWVAEGHRPDWQEGVARFEMLVDQGCGPQCFTFKQAYSPDGAPAVIDRSLVKERAAANAAVQGDLLETVLGLPV